MAKGIWKLFSLKQILLIIVGLLLWAVYERHYWYQDFELYDAPVLFFGPVNTTYKNEINAHLFKEATVYHEPKTLTFPEDIAVSNYGTIYTGLENGVLASISISGTIQTIYHHNDTGNLIGIIITSDDSTLYYVSEHRGLIKFDLTRRLPTYLLEELNEQKIPALNSLCIDEEKRIIYMTDSTPYPLKFSSKDILLKHQRGRIISYDLNTKEARIVLQNLAMPNGIVFDKATQSIIFSEMTHHKISRLSVNNQTAIKQALIQNLVGYPDNLKLSDNGDLYVAFPAVRDPSLQYLNQQPMVRKKLMYVPEQVLTLLTEKVAGGVKIDIKSGQIKQYIFGETHQIYFITTILQKNGYLYFSSLRNPTIVKSNKNNLIRLKEEVVVEEF